MDGQNDYDSILHDYTLEDLEKKLTGDDIPKVLYATQRPDYDDSEKPSSSNPDWMSLLPDSTKLETLSIPGSHNSMSLYGGSWVQCQSWSLMDIYNSGVRFVDIRCRHFNDTLPIHHEIIYQKTTFQSVLHETLRFLDYYPSETILMRIREEYKAANNKKTFQDLVNEQLTTYLPSHRLWTDLHLPNLEEARGKLIILRDFNDYRWVPYRTFNIDDKWDVLTLLHVDDKWKSVQSHLETANTGPMNEGYLTYSSGSGIGAFPSAVASRINKRLWDLLKSKPGKTRWGIIAMDFPGADLIKMIIDSNFDSP